MATKSEVVGWEDVAHRWEADSGPMQKHSSLDVELRRVFNLAQSVACLLLKAGNWRMRWALEREHGMK
mgnify:CR=1 FL=1